MLCIVEMILSLFTRKAQWGSQIRNWRRSIGKFSTSTKTPWVSSPASISWSCRVIWNLVRCICSKPRLCTILYSKYSMRIQLIVWFWVSTPTTFWLLSLWRVAWWVFQRILRFRHQLNVVVTCRLSWKRRLWMWERWRILFLPPLLWLLGISLRFRANIKFNCCPMIPTPTIIL